MLLQLLPNESVKHLQVCVNVGVQPWVYVFVTLDDSQSCGSFWDRIAKRVVLVVCTVQRESSLCSFAGTVPRDSCEPLAQETAFSMIIILGADLFGFKTMARKRC